MLTKPQTTLLFISIVSFTYILRDSNTSPGTLLRKHISRLLEDQQLTNALCSGISQENDITQSERDTAHEHTESYAEKRGGNPLVDFIEGPDPAGKMEEDYVKPVMRSVIFIMLLFVASLGFCIYFITAWTCVNYSFFDRFTICKGPQPGGNKIVFTVAVGIFALALAVTGIAGVVTSSGIKSGGNKIVCSVAIFAEKLLEGSDSEDWVGVEQMIADFQIVLNEFPSMVVKLTGAPSLTATTTASGMAGTLTTAQASVELFYTQNFAQKVSPRPDPAKAQASYTPTYILNLTNVKTAIEAEMTAKKAIVDQSAMRGDKGITKLRASSPIFLLLLQEANDVATNISKALASAESNITAIGENINNDISSLGSVLTGIFVVNLLLGSGAITATVLTFFAFKHALSFVNLSWCLISTIILVTWILSAALYPTTLILFESCDVGNRVLSNETFFNITMDKFVVKNATDGSENKNGAKVKDFLYTCYYGDGDLIAGLNLTEVFGMFTNIFVSLDNVSPLSKSVGPVPDSIIIPHQQSIVTGYRQGLTPDAQETIDDLAILNSLTNTQTEPCTQVQDTWVLNSTTCPASAGTVFKSSNAANFNLPSQTCIGYDAWGSKQINQRYTISTFPISCGTKTALPMNTYMQTFVNNFVNARNDVESIFEGVESGLSNVQTANSVYMASVTTATMSFDPVRTATVGTHKALWDPTTGFIQNSNCTFLKKATQDVLDSVCIRFGNSLYSTTAVTLGVSCFGFFAALLLFCFSMKFFAKKNEDYSHHLMEDHHIETELPLRNTK